MGKLVQPKTNYTIVSNYILRDNEISLQAKGLYAIMRALPDNWNFSANGLMQLSSNQRDATRNALIELEEKGYLVRTKYQNDKGQFDMDYEIFHTPKKKLPVTENPTAGSPTAENTADNKELKKQVLKNKEEHIAPDEQVQEKKALKSKVEFKSDHKDIADVIKAFEELDPKNKLYYSNSTQKKAVDFLIQEYSKEQVITVVQGIPKAKLQIPYFPSITTPCELRDKWKKMEDAFIRQAHTTKLNQTPKIRKEMV